MNEAWEQHHLEITTYLIALDIQVGYVAYQGNKLRNFQNINLL